MGCWQETLTSQDISKAWLGPILKDTEELGISIEDLVAALKLNQAAVCGTPLGHHKTSECQCNLAVSHKDKYYRTGNIQDLEIAQKYV
jgi:hypothetical protein